MAIARLRCLHDAQQRAMHVSGLRQRNARRTARCNRCSQQRRGVWWQARWPKISHVMIHVQWGMQHGGQGRQQPAQHAQVRPPQHVQLAVFIDRMERLQNLEVAVDISNQTRLKAWMGGSMTIASRR